MSKDLLHLQRFQADFDGKHEGLTPFLEPVSKNHPEALEHLVVCLAGEVGELANIAKRIRRGDKMYDQSVEAIIEETVDIFIYILKVANQVGFELQPAYFEKMERNRIRFSKFQK